MSNEPTKDQFIHRLRAIRENRHLTLEQAACLSNGEISAMALGSYERGDRSIAVSKLFIIATMYGVPITEIFLPADKATSEHRVTFDLRKISRDNSDLAQQLFVVLSKISHMRRDWNGEILSLRSEDVKNLANFSGFTSHEIEKLVLDYEVPRSK